MPIDDPDATFGLSVVWPAAGASPAVELAIAAARSVSDRESWLGGH